VAVLAQQADPVLVIDGHGRGPAGMAHDLERNPHAIGQLHVIQAHLDDPAREDFFSVDEHAGSLPAP
jgi:hypothetical protein